MIKGIEKVLDQEIMIASALIAADIILILGLFFRWIILILLIIFGIATFVYIKDLFKGAK